MTDPGARPAVESQVNGHPDSPRAQLLEPSGNALLVERVAVAQLIGGHYEFAIRVAGRWQKPVVFNAAQARVVVCALGGQVP